MSSIFLHAHWHVYVFFGRMLLSCKSSLYIMDISLYHSNDLQIFSPVLEGCLFSEPTYSFFISYLQFVYSILNEKFMCSTVKSYCYNYYIFKHFCDCQSPKKWGVGKLYPENASLCIYMVPCVPHTWSLCQGRPSRYYICFKWQSWDRTQIVLAPSLNYCQVCRYLEENIPVLERLHSTTWTYICHTGHIS